MQTFNHLVKLWLLFICVMLLFVTFFNGCDQRHVTSVLAFGSPSCAPCVEQASEIKSLCREFNVPLTKVNVDRRPDLARQFRVTSLPTYVIFQNGLVVHRSNNPAALREGLVKYARVRGQTSIWENITSGNSQKIDETLQCVPASRASCRASRQAS